MPSLTIEERPKYIYECEICKKCRTFGVHQYCRQCDEFYHQCECKDETGHEGHRTYEEWWLKQLPLNL